MGALPRLASNSLRVSVDWRGHGGSREDRKPDGKKQNDKCSINIHSYSVRMGRLSCKTKTKRRHFKHVKRNLCAERLTRFKKRGGGGIMSNKR